MQHIDICPELRLLLELIDTNRIAGMVLRG